MKEIALNYLIPRFLLKWGMSLVHPWHYLTLAERGIELECLAKIIFHWTFRFMQSRMLSNSQSTKMGIT